MLIGLVLLYFLSLFFNAFRKGQVGEKLLLGLVFSISGVLVMQFPIHMGEGFQVDLRNAIVILAGFFGGWPAYIMTSVSQTVFRSVIGGEGLLSGIFVIHASGMVGLLFYYLRKKYGYYTSLFLLLPCSLPPAYLAYLFLPLSVRSEIFIATILPVSILLPSKIFILGLLVIREIERRDDWLMLVKNREAFKRLSLKYDLQRQKIVDLESRGQGRVRSLNPRDNSAKSLLLMQRNLSIAAFLEKSWENGDYQLADIKKGLSSFQEFNSRDGSTMDARQMLMNWHSHMQPFCKKENIKIQMNLSNEKTIQFNPDLARLILDKLLYLYLLEPLRKNSEERLVYLDLNVMEHHLVFSWLDQQSHLSQSQINQWFRIADQDQFENWLPVEEWIAGEYEGSLLFESIGEKGFICKVQFPL